MFKEETYKIRGAVFEVYKEMGSGFLEAVYQECLRKEFQLQKIPFKEQAKLSISYKGQALEQRYQPDFICFGSVIVEIKGIKSLNESHSSQILNYLRATGLKVGLLVNFGAHPKVEITRLART